MKKYFKYLSLLFLFFFVSFYFHEDIEFNTISNIYEAEENYLGINSSPILNVFLNNNSFQNLKLSSIH